MASQETCSQEQEGAAGRAETAGKMPVSYTHLYLCTSFSKVGRIKENLNGRLDLEFHHLSVLTFLTLYSERLALLHHSHKHSVLSLIHI